MILPKCLVLAALLAGLAAPPGPDPLEAQGSGDPDWERPDPEDCTRCRNKPARMKKHAILSHGDFAFGRSDSAQISALFEGISIRWAESEHIKLGFADVEYEFWPGGGGDTPKPGKDSDDGGQPKQRMEKLATGALAFEPYHRTHVYLERAEAIYARVQEVLDVEDRDFPRPSVNGGLVQPKHMQGVYMGEGPYLGMAGKYELLVLPGQRQLEAYLRDPVGLAGTVLTNHLIRETDAMATTIHQLDGDMWEDVGVHGYMAHHLTHAFLEGYRHNSYPTPAWIQAGLAHAIEREIHPFMNSFCGDYEVAAAGTYLADWTAETKLILREHREPSLAELIAHETLADFTLADHVIAWSMVRYLMDEHPKAFAAINADLHGLSGGKQPVPQRKVAIACEDAIAKHLDQTPEEFDKAWRKWAKRQDKRL